MGTGSLETTTPELRCPSCRRDVVTDPDGRWVECPQCRVLAPTVDGFVMWNERFVDIDAATARSDEITGRGARYRELLERKRSRQLYEPYAWFRPYNESTRALEPFRALLAEAVPPGAAILDLWCRTGWTGEMLAGWFPHNPVVSLWEGDKDQLGYQGFRHWLPPGRRAPNLEIVFAGADEPLPFADDTFAFVHGLDTLHRYPHAPLIGECLRVATSDAPILFPHVHLANSEPDPFFERGCMQFHGEVWGRFLDRLCQGTARRAWVLSERDLYLLNGERPLTDDRSTTHYNGFVAIGPEAWDGAALQRPVERLGPDQYMMTSQLLTIDTVTGRASIDPTAKSGTVGYMTKRHPVAVEALAQITARELTSEECRVLSRCVVPTTAAELSGSLGYSLAELEAIVRPLVHERALQLASISQAMADLQAQYQELHAQRGYGFAELWHGLAARYGDRHVLVGADGSSFDATQVGALVDSLRDWFADCGIEAGRSIALMSEPHIEYPIAVWAAWLSGLIVAPLPHDLSPEQLDRMLQQLDPAVVFCDTDRTAHFTAAEIPIVVFDSIDPTDDPAPAAASDPQASRPQWFIDVVEPGLERPSFDDTAFDDTAFDHALSHDPVDRDPGSPAAVIATSGSTGDAKSVELSMQSLIHSARSIISALELGDSDRFLSTGSMHTMSGFRNPIVAALVAGATVVIDADAAASALGIAEACRRHEVTVAATSPTVIDRLDALGDRVRPAALRTVRLIATTADRLDHETAAAVRERYDLQIVDYYGLTETGGIVVVANPALEGALGRPIGAAVEIVAADGKRSPVGTAGELRVSGPSVMNGYVGDAHGVRFEDGWVYTGDLAVAHHDGSISLLGRLVDQLKRRSGEIYPHLAVLELLRSHPGVQQADATADSETRAIIVAIEPNAKQDATLLRDELLELIDAELGATARPDRLVVTP